MKKLLILILAIFNTIIYSGGGMSKLPNPEHEARHRVEKYFESIERDAYLGLIQDYIDLPGIAEHFAQNSKSDNTLRWIAIEIIRYKTNDQNAYAKLNIKIENKDRLTLLKKLIEETKAQQQSNINSNNKAQGI